ncbi:hypothetical protein M2150_002246 [Lachnospiraceae bacterium PM6-15]|uniref:Uncharacterized protein n=1 Tax=Ohessyouella blattaphilus TaxID=2949333 RepID=A0ABT1EKS9_9FIRM|nr:hypothetical protein [Ohessyouella blattaphilus]MCP1111309.1 hypothetical protein [Ohessyouella blattaphilus]MCR8564703.1 hypothetical protein [Ohessyouella blattaphilus]MDL2250280.1 hypothetical protein [Lachnospiraceae bacterium OttesenSCG-928-J05]
MRGIRQQTYLQDRRFLNFFERVQEAAASEDKVFFMDTGEGHEYEKGNVYGEDLGGWLVAKEKAASFEERYCNFDKSLYYDFEEDICFAEWEEQGEEIIITFRSYE